MKKIYFLISILFVFLIGCSTVSYIGPDGSRISYTRVGDQELSGLTVNKDGNGLNVQLDGQKSEATALVEAVRVIGEMSKGTK